VHPFDHYVCDRQHCVSPAPCICDRTEGQETSPQRHRKPDFAPPYAIDQRGERGTQPLFQCPATFPGRRAEISCGQRCASGIVPWFGQRAIGRGARRASSDPFCTKHWSRAHLDRALQPELPEQPHWHGREAGAWLGLHQRRSFCSSTSHPGSGGPRGGICEELRSAVKDQHSGIRRPAASTSPS